MLTLSDYQTMMISKNLTTLLTLSTFTLLSFISASVNACGSSEAANTENAIEDGYVRTKTDCQVYRPALSFGNHVKWSGDCPSGYAEGQGVAEWYNEKAFTSRYQGIFIQGKLQGAGRIDWEVETNCGFDYYEGELTDSDILGRGVLHYTDGNIYDGIFGLKDQPTKAVFTWGVGNEHHSDRYEGGFLNGQIHGKGVYTWGEYSPWAGDVYEGEYYKNLQHGFGIYTEGNGNRYEGQWLKGKRSGYAKMIYADGSVFEGEWNSDFGNNYGNKKWPDGASYDGQFLNGNPHGKGKMTYASGAVYQGDYEYGQRQGMGKITNTDGAWLEGEFRDDAPNGESINVRANGIRYAGSFIEGKAWGFGHLTAPRAAYDDDKRAKNGTWQGDTFVEKGWFYDNKFKFPCESTEDCIKIAQSDTTKQKYLDFLNE